jgi:SAM-dependent methyltransferase
MKTNNQPQYGNWVATRLIIMFAVLAVLCIGGETLLCLFTQGQLAMKILFAIPGVFVLAAIAYFCYARRMFSPEGGDIQNKVLDLLVSHIEWDGQGSALDIGCGSGALTIKVSQRYPVAGVTGLDVWGVKWGYGKAQCEGNAALEGVGERTMFVHGSADHLPFRDGTFDLVVSNMTFHEVKPVADKLDLVREALRVVKPGGKFVFQDLFLIKSYFGTPEALIAAVEAAGGTEVRFEPTHNAPFIPKPLKLSFMLGTAGVLWGEKR